MDQTGVDQILRNRRLDDFGVDGQSTALVKLLVYLGS